jgi:hypothetical protein
LAGSVAQTKFLFLWWILIVIGKISIFGRRNLFCGRRPKYCLSKSNHVKPLLCLVWNHGQRE